MISPGGGRGRDRAPYGVNKIRQADGIPRSRTRVTRYLVTVGVGGSANSSHKCGIIMIRIWAKVMAENVLLSSPRWADKQMPDPGLALRQEAKIRPATASGDLLLRRRISEGKKIVTRSLHAEPSWLPVFVSTFAKFFL